MKIRGSPPGFLIVILGVAFLLLAQGTALADIQVGGSSSGSFLNGSTNLGSSVTVNNGDIFGNSAKLSFSGASFGPQSSSTTLNLGSFGLTDTGCFFCSFNFNPYTFGLSVNFTVPVGTSSTLVTADVLGTLSWLNNSVDINFGAPTHYTYSNSSGSGSFDLTVHDVTSIPLSGSGGLTANIGNATFTASSGGAANPEPASIALLGSLIVGLAFMRKRLSA